MDTNKSEEIKYIEVQIDEILSNVQKQLKLSNGSGNGIEECFNLIEKITKYQFTSYSALFVWVSLRDKSIKLSLDYKLIIEKFKNYIDQHGGDDGLNENLKLLKSVYKDSIVENTFIQKDIRPIQKYYLSNYGINESESPTQLIKVYNEFKKESMVLKHNYADKKLFTRVNMTEYEKTHPFVNYKTFVKPSELDDCKLGINNVGDWSINPSLELFKDCFDTFTNGVLDGIDWGFGDYDVNSTQKVKVIASGGSVSSCLNPLPKDILSKYHDMNMVTRLLNHLKLPFQAVELIVKYSKPYSPFKESLHDHFHSMNSPYLQSDLDLFFISPSIHQGKLKLEEIANKIKSNMTGRKDFTDLRFVRTQNSVTILSSYPYRPIQLMIFFIRSIEDLITFYDLDCVCTSFNGDNVLVLPRAVNAFNKRLNMVPPALFNEENDRMYKYCYRGFNSICFENCIHEQRCDRKSYLYTSILKSVELDAYKRPIFQISSYNQDSASMFSFPYGPEKSFEDVLSELKDNGYQSSENFKSSLFNETFDTMANKTKIGTSKKDRAGDWDDDDDDEYDEYDEDFIYPKKVHPVDWRFKFIKIKNLSSNVTFRCYMCKDELYDTKGRLCSSCTSKNRNILLQFHSKIKLATPVLNEKYAIVTGARTKIGFETASLLLKDGFNVIITTRFPNSALEKYQSKFTPLQLKKLFIYGLDFRNVSSVQSFIDSIKLKFPRIDILINNAAQTIRRPRAYYYNLIQNEKKLISLQSIGSSIGNVLALTNSGNTISPTEFIEKILIESQDTEEMNFQLFPNGKFDDHGDQLDLRSKTSWTQTVDEISVVEVAEVLLVNSTIPLMLVSQLSCMMGENKLLDESTLITAADQKYQNAKKSIVRNDWSVIVNVTSPEGNINNEANSFSGYHVHTNMAKSSLNMMTQTIAYQYEKKNIYVCGSDTGWVSSMTPVSNDELKGTPPPLTELDGAKRVVYPIYRHLFDTSKLTPGVQFINFSPTPWN